MSRVLIVDDDGVACETLSRFVRVSGFEVLTAPTSTEGLQLARTIQPDVIVLDDCFPEGPSGREVLRTLRRERRTTPVIMISGYGTCETVFEAARLGAVDYVTKPVFGDALVEAVKSALRLGPPVADASRAEPQDAASAILGRSPAMRQVRRHIRQISASGGGALIEGETGTGKELVARAIHNCGRRARQAFVAVNCGALSQSLIESELYGHRRGAFTGATDTRPGFFDAAHRGTLFLDEISTLPLALQPALLRALESGEVRRGDTLSHHVDVCVVAATNTALSEAVQSGAFRQDLLYRLNTFRIVLPPLRARPDDILLLAAHFLEQRTSGSMILGLDAREALLAHEWPGNVRELQHAIHRAVAFADGGIIRAENLPPEVWGTPDVRQHVEVLLPASVEGDFEQERRRLVAALLGAQWRIGKAARELHIGRTTMWKLMRKHDVQRTRSGQ